MLDVRLVVGLARALGREVRAVDREGRDRVLDRPGEAREREVARPAIALGDPAQRALVEPAALDRGRDRLRGGLVAGVVPVALAGQRHVHRVMEVIGPHGIEPELLDDRRVVAIIFGHQQHGAIERPRELGDLAQDVVVGRVDDRVHGIEAQAVKPEVDEPARTLSRTYRRIHGFAKFGAAPHPVSTSVVKYAGLYCPTTLPAGPKWL